MANIILGKIAITWKGEFDTNTTYYKQDVVRNGANTYICTADSFSGVFDSQSWDMFAQGTTDIASVSGDLIYHNGTELVRLPIGANNQILTVDSFTGLPTWQSVPTRSSQRVKYLQPNEYVQINAHAVQCIMEDETMRSWGYGGHYQHGVGTPSSDVSNPQIVPFPFGFPGIKENKIWSHYAYGYFAIDNNDDLWSWGRIEYGVTGTGGDAWTPVNIMEVNDPLNHLYGTGVKANTIAMSTGQESYVSQLIIGSDGLVYGAGYNGYGQVADGTTTNQSFFTKSSFFENLKNTEGVTVEKLKMGRDRYTACFAVTSDHRLFAWGYNGDYQLGNNSTTSTSIPFHVNQGSIQDKDIVDVFPTYLCAFALDSNNTLHFVGGDQYGCSGFGVNTGSGTVNATTRLFVQTATDVAQISFTPYNYPTTYILKTDGTVYGTGYNGYGQLGIGSTAAQSIWTAMDLSMLKNGEVPVKIFCCGTGSYQSFGLLTDQGRVYTCGYNGYGQLGIGNATTQTVLQEVICRNRIVDAQFQGYEKYQHLCVLLEDGQMLTCGSGDNYAMASEDAEEYYTLSPIRF